MKSSGSCCEPGEMSIARFLKIASTGKHTLTLQVKKRTLAGSSMAASSINLDYSMPGFLTCPQENLKTQTRLKDWQSQLPTRRSRWREWSPIEHPLLSKTVLAS